MTPPLDTDESIKLIDIVSTSGAKTLSLAGGDPLLRRDILTLTNFAHELGLRVEIQTNGHALNADGLEALMHCHRVCLSLDGSTAELHDSIRRRRGNFKRVVAVADELAAQNVPISVRTVITNENRTDVKHLAALVSSFKSCDRWTLLEFTPVNDGFKNRADYEMSGADFEAAVAEVREEYQGTATIDVFRNRNKVGAYLQITSDGHVYGVTNSALNLTGSHKMAGSILTDHLNQIAHTTAFDRDQHALRYAWELAGEVV